MMSFTVFRQVYQTIGRLPAEQGGILGAARDVICRFYFDTDGRNSDSIYCPNAKRINRILEEWANEGITFCGVIHSHPKGDHELSFKDLEFGRAILKDNPHLKCVFFPIVYCTPDTAMLQIMPYVIKPRGITIAGFYLSNQI